jgi:predicted small lipoprotein YifL
MRLAGVAVMVALPGLVACGQKGPLTLPAPKAAAAPAATAQPASAPLPR